MLQQMSEATLTLLLTMLAVGAVIRFMPAAGHGRRGKKARSVAVWAGIGLGMISSLVLTVINVEAPKAVNRQTVHAPRCGCSRAGLPRAGRAAFAPCARAPARRR